MIAARPEFEATGHDTVVVIHDFADYHFAIVTTRLRVESGAGVTEVIEKLRVVPDGDGIYRIQLTVPAEEVIKASRWGVTVLLPPGARYAGDEDVEQESRVEGGRNVLAWSGEQDPLIDVLWSYIR